MAPISRKPLQQWPCQICSKSFGRKGDLVRHKLLHAGHKPHVCSVCKKAFSQFSGLKTHRNIHSGGKPYTCGYPDCKSAFGDPSSCARHRKETHLRTEPFKCGEQNCSTSIKRRSAFVAHLNTKHNKFPTRDEIDAMAPPLLPVPVTFVGMKTSRQSDPQHDFTLPLEDIDALASPLLPVPVTFEETKTSRPSDLQHDITLPPEDTDIMVPPLLPVPVTFVEMKTSRPSAPQHDFQTSFVLSDTEFFIEADNFSAPPPYMAEEQHRPPSYYQPAYSNSPYSMPLIPSFDSLASPISISSPSSRASSTQMPTPMMDPRFFGQNPLNLSVAQSLPPSRSGTPYIWGLSQQWMYPQDLTKSYLPYDLSVFDFAPRERMFCS